jgi:branched-chain amino acid aminotransferase
LEQFIDAHIKTVKVNEFDECYLRPIMYCDAGSFGLAAVNRTRAAIVAREWGAYLGEGALENGIRAKISSFNRHHVNVGMVQGKICGQYTTSILAKREAIAGGYQEAIMLDTMGYVAEGTGENIFVVKDGVIITPPITSPILPGITRDTIIHVARNMNMEVREDKFTRDFVYLCDEVFVVGTAAEVTPVREVDDRPIGTGKPGPITQRLQKAYFDIVRGKDDYYKHWLSKI